MNNLYQTSLLVEVLRENVIEITKENRTNEIDDIVNFKEENLSISLDVNIECIAEDLSHAITPNELKQQLGYYGLSSIYHIDGVYYFTTLL